MNSYEQRVTIVTTPTARSRDTRNCGGSIDGPSIWTSDEGRTSDVSQVADQTATTLESIVEIIQCPADVAAGVTKGFGNVLVPDHDAVPLIVPREPRDDLGKQRLRGSADHQHREAKGAVRCDHQRHTPPRSCPADKTAPDGTEGFPTVETCHPSPRKAPHHPQGIRCGGSSTDPDPLHRSPF